MKLEEAIILLKSYARSADQSRAEELSDFLMISLKQIENVEYTFEYSDRAGRAIKTGFIAVGAFPDPIWALEEALIKKYKAEKIHLISYNTKGGWKTVRYKA